MSSSPSSQNRARGGARPLRSTRSGASVEASGRRRACNECKQQKLRCDLASDLDGSPAELCGRCNRLNLDCRIEDGFRRTRKRRRSADLADEIVELRKQLAEARNTDVSLPVPVAPAGSLDDWAMPNPVDPQLTSSTFEGVTQASCQGVTALLQEGPGKEFPDQSPDVSATSHTPGLTTRPDADELQPRRTIAGVVPYPRSLGSTSLSVDSIAEIFQLYTINYHPFLPLVDITKPPDYHYQQSELLFWSIISIASRRLETRPTLLPKLARDVTSLLWTTIRSVPNSLATVQALALLCTWPFPISSSMSDPTFMLVGIMLQLATQMGLHRAVDAQDFTKAPTRLTSEEHGDWIRTWKVCNIVAQSVSVGCGLPLFLQLPEIGSLDTNEARYPTNDTMPLQSRLRIEHFRQRVSTSLGTDSVESQSRQRLSHCRLLNAELRQLEHTIGSFGALSALHMSAARLHLHAFYLFDDASSDGYNDRIMELSHTARTLITLTLELDQEEPGILSHCPFFSCQVFVCAAFVVLKISTNGFFRNILDVESSTQLLERSITALRKMSVVNNDMAARLGDVLAFFCTLPDSAAVGGSSIEDLRLRQVNTRLSMSIVHDFLRTWRSHFRKRNDEVPFRGSVGNGGDKCSPSLFVISTPNDFQDIMGFDFPMGMASFLDMDMSF